MKFIGKIRLVEAFKNRREPESVHELADAYWHVLLILCVLGAIAIVAYDLWEFSSVDQALNAQPTTAASAEEKPPFDRAQLHAIVEGVEKRKVTNQLYTALAPVVSDPSELPKIKPSH